MRPSKLCLHRVRFSFWGRTGGQRRVDQRRSREEVRALTVPSAWPMNLEYTCSILPHISPSRASLPQGDWAAAKDIWFLCQRREARCRWGACVQEGV